MLSPICETEEHYNNHSPSPTASGRIATCDPADPFGISPVVYSNANGRNISSSCFYSKTTSVDSRCNNDDCQFDKKMPGNFLSRLSKRRHRLVQKNGEYNISLANVPKQKLKYFSDMFSTMIEMKWRWLLLLFTFCFLLSWLFFAGLYYLLMYIHKDLDDNVNSSQDWTPCISNTKTFISVFLFSVETQHTIGYGSRHPNESCPEVVIILCLQSIFGLMMQTLLVGVVFAKLARPQKRAETLIFSKRACICMRDGKLCFLLRVGDMRKSHLAEAHIRLQLISKRITNEGELLPFHQYEMNVGFQSGLDRIFVVWPITICHVIDETSPLYECSAEDLASSKFEVTAILEGVVHSGATMQARTSYLPSEILWGYRFEKLITYQRDNGKYKIDFSKFHKITAVDTPTLSAKELDVMRKVGFNVDRIYHCDNSEVENSGVTPSDSETDIEKDSSNEKNVEQNEEKSDGDDDVMLPPINLNQRQLSRKVSIFDGQDEAVSPEEIIRRHRRMSTMSQKLDKWALEVVREVAKETSVPSQNSKLAGSQTSLTNFYRRQSILREHDIM